ncbi:MAG: hypothetical protein ABIT76_09100 [Chthoniobacterales bacterium]
MAFETSAYLRKATSRAKSDVANKLVSMFLHEVSRKISTLLQMNVADSDYAEAVSVRFGSSCCYCRNPLEPDRASVEHLDGMNRFRAGLHIPGNVIVSCKRCNNEKRRDDQLRELKLASSGWASFLSHDSLKCENTCKTCQYWKLIWPNFEERQTNLRSSLTSILEFRAKYEKSTLMGLKCRDSLHEELERLYRECQAFATSHIKGSVDRVVEDLELTKAEGSA